MIDDLAREFEVVVRNAVLFPGFLTDEANRQTDYMIERLKNKVAVDAASSWKRY